MVQVIQILSAIRQQAITWTDMLTKFYDPM